MFVCFQSQLANILAVQSLAKEFLEDKISVFAAYPGLCDTLIERHTGLNKSISGSLVANNILWFLHRSNLGPPFSSQDHISDVF